MTSEENVGLIYDEIPLVNGDFQGAEIMYQEGTRALLVQDEDGNIFIPTVGQLLIDDDDVFVKQESIMEQEEIAEQAQQIIYYADEMGESEQGVQLIQYVDENGEMVEQQQDRQGFFDAQLQVGDNVESEGDMTKSGVSCQYAIIKDGKLLLQPSDSGDILDYLQDEQMDDYERVSAQVEETSNHSEINAIDVTKITGKNLITGQTITLDGYLDKLMGKINDTKFSHAEHLARQKHPGNDENKSVVAPDNKFVVGRTTSGKKLVGKIVRIERKNQDNSEPNDDFETAEPTTKTVIVKRNAMSRDTFDYVCRMMAGLMTMDSVHKKLNNKNLKVKLVEKDCTDQSRGANKIISRLYGYMTKQREISETEWKFMPLRELPGELGAETKAAKSALIEGTTDEDFAESPYVDSASLTLIITTDKSGKRSMRVNLTPCYKKCNSCTACGQKFFSHSRLWRHMEECHARSEHKCDVCDRDGFRDKAALERHKKLHEKEMHRCSVCERLFSSYGKMRRHMAVHKAKIKSLEELMDDAEPQEGIRVYQCGLCGTSFANLDDLNVHLRAHEPTRNFECGVCGRQFSRHSNLLRHIAIHKGEGALYQCEICGCSYNFVSSLTRHMVQKHIKAAMNGE